MLLTVHEIYQRQMEWKKSNGNSSETTQHTHTDASDKSIINHNKNKDTTDEHHHLYADRTMVHWQRANETENIAERIPTSRAAMDTTEWNTNELNRIWNIHEIIKIWTALTCGIHLTSPKRHMNALEKCSIPADQCSTLLCSVFELHCARMASIISYYKFVIVSERSWRHR